MEETVLKAEPRMEFGSRSARRLRRKGHIPANIYGHKQENVLVSIDAKDFSRFLEAGHRIVTLSLGSKSERSVVKEVQYDAFGTTPIHADFTRIRSDEKIQVEVPVEPIGVPKGVSGGGVLIFPVQELLVSGLPDDIPERYQVNIESLEIGNILRLKDLTPPPKCTFVGDPEMVIISIAQKREEIPVAAPVEAQPAQPEVIGKKKEETEEGEEPEAKKKEKEKEKDKDKEKEK